MFHQSVAIYSKAHCLNMLATAKITARGCLCVREPTAILLLLLKLVIPVDDSWQKKLSGQVCFSPVLFHNEVWTACVFVCESV